ncbi:hypothetical protein EYF80_007664 [Liparis tanakae]|uniref:Uncharacterized protein n=1 Tax=Liparis tanakae TaxID=230148 RepID=A0A4Z2IWX2_9TELE|nr:hypothetical protein EYF80_007664 [Liparis tanakae]
MLLPKTRASRAQPKAPPREARAAAICPHQARDGESGDEQHVLPLCSRSTHHYRADTRHNAALSPQPASAPAQNMMDKRESNAFPQLESIQGNPVTGPLLLLLPVGQHNTRERDRGITSADEFCSPGIGLLGERQLITSLGNSKALPRGCAPYVYTDRHTRISGCLSAYTGIRERRGAAALCSSDG